MTHNNMHRPPRSRSFSSGFTLLELMIVVVVISILSAIALPAYSEYTRRAHRADARTGLMQAQQWLERASTATGKYPTVLPDALKWAGDPSKRYDISFSGDAAAYTLTATPKSNGPQAGDKCGAYTLSNVGVRGANGKKTGDTGYNADCWGK